MTGLGMLAERFPQELQQEAAKAFRYSLRLRIAEIWMKVYQNLGGFSSLTASAASLKMKPLKTPVLFTPFHLYFRN